MLTHWKTTLSGLVAAILSINVNGMSVKSFALAAAITGLGLLAKDHDKGN